MNAKKGAAIGIYLAWIFLFVWAVWKDFDIEIIVLFAVLAVASISSSSLVLFGSRNKGGDSCQKNSLD